MPVDPDSSGWGVWPIGRERTVSRVLLGLVAAVLVAAGLLQVIPLRDLQQGDRSRPVEAGRLATRLPAEIRGWAATDLPLGPSEFVQDAVLRNLNLDDYIFRIYRRGEESFGVYIAYWSPGRMPVHKVASHTPDRCWTESGWSCTDMRFGEMLALRGEHSGRREANADLTVSTTALSAGRVLRPAQWRRFKSPHGFYQHVLYWHLVGGDLYDYGERFNAWPHPLKWWRDTLDYAIKGSREQYFIRLTSEQPFEMLAEEEGFQAVLAGLAAMGLAAVDASPARH